jgi:hypothetical protein
VVFPDGPVFHHVIVSEQPLRDARCWYRVGSKSISRGDARRDVFVIVVEKQWGIAQSSTCQGEEAPSLAEHRWLEAFHQKRRGSLRGVSGSYVRNLPGDPCARICMALRNQEQINLERGDTGNPSACNRKWGKDQDIL